MNTLAHRLAGLLTLGCWIAASAAAGTADIFGTEATLAKLAPEFRSQPLGGCELPSRALTLAEAVDLALCRNPTTRAAWAAARVEAAALGEADSAWLPQVSLSGSDNHTQGSGLYSASQQDGRNAVATLSWTLLDFGARDSSVTSAKRLLAAAARTGSATAQRTVADTAQAYYRVLAADQTVAANRITEGNAARSLEIAKALQSGGAATLADVMQAETAYQQTVYARVQSGSVAKASRADLAVRLGYPADQPLQLAAAPAPAPISLTTQVGELLSVAARENPTLLAARDSLAAADAGIEVARSQGRPRLSVGALHSVNDITGLPRQNADTLGFQVSIPVFSGFQTHYSVRRAEAARDESAAQLENTRLNVSLAVWTAYAALEAANDQLTTSATLAKAAATNEEIAIGRYQSGVGSMLDVLTAQSAGANARLIRIQSELAWQSARADLALAVGRLRSAADLEAVAHSP